MGSDKKDDDGAARYLTLEEIERLGVETVERKELYTNAALLARVLKQDGNDARQAPIKSKSGVWLKPGDPDYEAARIAALVLENPLLMQMMQQQPQVEGDPSEDKEVHEKSTCVDKKTHDEARIRFDQIEERRARFQEGFSQVASVVQSGGVTGRNSELLAKDASKRVEREIAKRVRTGGNAADLRDVRRKMATVNGFDVPELQDVDRDSPSQQGSGTRRTLPSARERRRNRTNQALNDQVKRQKGIDIT